MPKPTITLHLLKIHREQKGWTQECVAEFAALSPRTIQRIESGSPTSRETANALASVFDLDSYKQLQEPLFNSTTCAPEAPLAQLLETESYESLMSEYSTRYQHYEDKQFSWCVRLSLAAFITIFVGMLVLTLGFDVFHNNGVIDNIGSAFLFTVMFTLACCVILSHLVAACFTHKKQGLNASLQWQLMKAEPLCLREYTANKSIHDEMREYITLYLDESHPGWKWKNA